VVNVSARNISSRYTNFDNSEKTGGYTIFNAYVDLAARDHIGPLKNAKLRFNVDNIADKDYLGTITTTINTPATFRPGPPRTFQVTLTAEY
jgi:iron complex outermembrane receptor protein